MLTGRDVVLRAWQERDLAFLHELRNDASMQLALMGEPRPHTADQTRHWIETRTATRDGVCFVIAPRTDGEAIGLVELRSIRTTHGHAMLGICLRRSAQRRGWAAEAVNLIERYAHDVLGLRKVVLHVLESHRRAVQVYERAGYQRVGIHHGHFYYAGNYHHVLVMEKMLEVSSENCALPWMQ